MARKPLAFSPSQPDAVAIEIQRLDRQHVLLGMSSHSHEFLEIIYFERGSGQYQLENRVWNVMPGDLFLTAPYEAHDASKLTTAQGWIVLFTAAAVNLPGLEASSYLQWIGSPLLFPFARVLGVEGNYLHISEAERPQWLQRFQSLDQELQHQPFGYQEMGRLLLSQMLIDITRLLLSRFGNIPIHVSPLLTQVFKFIENNYTQAISLNDLSESLNLSSSYLSTSVRKMTGRTVSEWIRERRMAEARRLLLETDDDVVQIAEMIGYKEVTYFIRQFRQLHFKTPQVWRQVNY